MNKYLFLYDNFIWYRIPLLEKLSKKNFEIFINKKNNQEYFFSEKLKIDIKNLYFSNFSFFSLYSIIKNSTSDYVIIGGWDSISQIIKIIYNIFLCNIFKKKIILWNNVRWRGENTRFAVKFLDYILSKIFKNINKVVVGSILSEKYVKNELKVSSDKIIKIFNVSEVWLPQKGISKIYTKLLKRNEINILFVGRAFLGWKGVNYLENAFLKLKIKYKNLSLFIVGDKKDKFNQKKDIYHIKSITPDKISHFYRNSNIFVLPSIEDDKGMLEAWGLVVNEAYQFKLPVIVTNKVGCSLDIVDKKWVVEEKNSLDLANKLEALIKDKGLREKEGLKNHKKFNKSLRYNDIAKEWRIKLK